MIFTLFSELAEVQVSSLGASLVSWKVMDKHDNYRDVIIGWDDEKLATNDSPYFGCIVGRVANRIDRGTFYLDGKPISLPLNNGINHLHGGPFGLCTFSLDYHSLIDCVMAEFHISVEPRHDGYPGAVDVFVTYLLEGDSLIVICAVEHSEEFVPVTTIVNPALHPYFNLSGGSHPNILDHELQVYGSHYLETNEALIPTGQILPIAKTPLDFTKATKIGENIEKVRTEPYKGYDHYFTLPEHGTKMIKACSLYHEDSGLRLEVSTDAPGFQIYSGNFISNFEAKKDHKDLGLKKYNENAGIAIECHAYPDAINHDQWRNQVTLNPGETWKSSTKYKIYLDKQ